MADADKTCTKCHELKPAIHFRERRNRDQKPYASGACRECEREYHRSRTKEKRESPQWRHARWVTNLKSRHRITKEQYIDMALEQDFRCALCLRPTLFDKFIVDHDHACCDSGNSCGKCVRGLLDQGCNTLLGMARDNVATLTRAQAYLEERSVQNS